MPEAEPFFLEEKEKRDFYISYTPRDSQWAQWIAFSLQEQGYSVILPEWDFHPGTNIILETHKAISQCERTIALLSPQYLTAMYTLPDWTVAFQEGKVNEQPRLLPIRIQSCEIEGILKPYRIIDLVDLTEDAARERLADSLKKNPPRWKQRPRFPGRAATILGPLPDRDPLFLGREEILKSLYRLLHSGNTIVALTPSVSAEKQRSIGKTAIAVEYVYRNQCEYDAILWLSQNPEDPSPEALFESINQLVKQVDETDLPGEKPLPPLDMLKHWLERHTNWLLVIDGITTIQVLHELFPLPKHGKCILTSRERSIASIAHLIEVEDRPPEEQTLSQKIRHLVNAALHGENGEHFPLGIGTITIGSARDNQIQLDHASVAPYHATIQLHDGSYTLTDLQSPCGTFLNRQRLTPHQPYRLQPEDAIQIGQKWLAFDSDVTRLVVPPVTKGFSSPAEIRHSGYARMIAREQQKEGNALTAPTRPALTHVADYIEAVKQQNIPSTWLICRADQPPPSHLSNEDLHDVAFLAKLCAAFLLATLFPLTLLLSLSDEILPVILCTFTLNVFVLLCFAIFMIARITKPPHPSLSPSPHAFLVIMPEGFIEYLNEQEIVQVSFSELAGIGIEYDENGMPWLELSSFHSPTRFWRQQAYFGSPEGIAEKIFLTFLAYRRTVPVA